MEKEYNNDNNILCDVFDCGEKSLSFIYDEGINADNIEFTSKVIDIMKDIKNIEYWKQKEEYMMYRNDYNPYERGRYNEGSYNTRGGRGRYRGEEMLDEMKYHYGNYQNSYNYGAKEESSHKMTEAFKEFAYAVSEELEPQDRQLFKQAMQEMVQKMM